MTSRKGLIRRLRNVLQHCTGGDQVNILSATTDVGSLMMGGGREKLNHQDGNGDAVTG